MFVACVCVNVCVCENVCVFVLYFKGCSDVSAVVSLALQLCVWVRLVCLCVCVCVCFCGFTVDPLPD